MNHADLSVLMVIEGEIATTQLVEQILHACRPFGVRYRKVYLDSLTFGHLDRWTVPLFVRWGSRPGAVDRAVAAGPSSVSLLH